MPPLSCRSRMLASGAAILCGAVLWHGAVQAAPLSVCIDSSSSAAARDEALAQRVAAQEGTGLAVHHFDGDGGDDGFSAKEFRDLLASSCDMVLGYPLDTTDGTPPPGLKVTVPYDQTGFTLVTQGDVPAARLAELPAGTEVAVTYGTVPNLYFITHRNITADIHLSEPDTLKALVDGKVKAAMIWQPTIAQYLAAHAGAKFGVHALAEPHARWNIVALYAPRSAGAAAAFEANIAVPKKAGALEMPSMRYVQLASVAAGDGGGVPALYTDAQAKSGASKYSDNCAQCHGDKLEGMSGPALKGALFASAKTGFSVGDILSFMSINMPATQPGSLAHDDYTDIMAYVLQQNGFPAGSAALTYDDGMKSKVPLLYHGK